MLRAARSRKTHDTIVEKVRGTRTTDQPKALDCEDVQGPRQVVAPSARLCDGRVVNHLHPN